MKMEAIAVRRARPSLSGRLVGGAVIAVLFMGSTLLTPLYEIYRETYRFSHVVLVLLYAVYVVGNLVALLLLGRLADQIGRKPVMLAGLALSAASALVFLLATALPWLFVGRAVSGLAVGVGAGAATASIVEFTPEASRARAASVMTAFNFLGLTLGPVLAGLLVQYAPYPLRLSFWAYLPFVALAAVLAAGAPETLQRRGALSLKPRLGVPRELWGRFAAPALSGFLAMAVVGFYAALGPSTVRDALHIANRALASAAIAELFAVAAIVILATQAWPAHQAVRGGMLLAPAGLWLLVAGQRSGGVVILLAAITLCGAAAALGYRGGLGGVNALAPPERRAEVVSTFFVGCFCGNALPVIGVGVLTETAGTDVAVTSLAAFLSVIALLALGLGFAFKAGNAANS